RELFCYWVGELNPEDYENFALPAVQHVISGISGKVPVIYYTKASNHLMSAVARSGATVLSVDWRVDLAALRKTLGPKIALQGNADPAVLLGPTGKIREATQPPLSALNGMGHILNLGRGIFKQTPVENARLFIETGQQTVVYSAGKTHQPTSAAYSR